jgi:hypothetical protein
LKTFGFKVKKNEKFSRENDWGRERESVEEQEERLVHTAG